MLMKWKFLSGFWHEKSLNTDFRPLKLPRNQCEPRLSFDSQILVGVCDKYGRPCNAKRYQHSQPPQPA
ncbi:hypothetical protein A0H81_00915 [Grifola frondosa]|uniref:Uncharacterized protein n=1 Tax=Grifola frondosa TaxID=5627 RepID=A0A1C7MT82_GRIFR|nr:hypothetical protein A0H81_00915 [Grifola frondosa]